jgi:hypothetical protein
VSRQPAARTRPVMSTTFKPPIRWETTLIWTITVLAGPLTVLIAWIAWLLFNLLIAKRHGLDGLKSTPAIARAFSPREWLLQARAPGLHSPGQPSLAPGQNPGSGHGSERR